MVYLVLDNSKKKAPGRSHVFCTGLYVQYGGQQQVVASNSQHSGLFFLKHSFDRIVPNFA